MNVKSRAQLIVWCLPHLGFVESEARVEASAAQAAQQNTYTQSIPAGSSTVTTLPGSGINRTVNGTNGNGNSDIGMGGL